MHHALLYISSDRDLSILPPDVHLQSADVTHIVVATFGVDDSRLLYADANKRPFEAQMRSFVISANLFTVEAQNALLKLLEEPPESARFFLVVAHENVLLPTLRSRLQIVQTDNAPALSKAWDDFIEKSLADRIAIIADLAKHKKAEEMTELLMLAIHDQRLPRQTALLLDTYGRQSGASKKMLLELASLMRQ